MHKALQAMWDQRAPSSGSSRPPPSGIYFLIHISLLNGLLFYNQRGLAFVGKPRVIRYGLMRDALCVRAGSFTRLACAWLLIRNNSAHLIGPFTPERRHHQTWNNPFLSLQIFYWWCGFHTFGHTCDASMQPQLNRSGITTFIESATSVIHLRLILNGCWSLRSVRVLQQVALFIKPKRLMMVLFIKGSPVIWAWDDCPCSG